MNQLFAQATGMPNNGASNAEDFQPPTRNPQTAPGNLQPGVGPQETGVKDLLNDPNVRIVVPKTTPADPLPPPKKGDLNVFAAIIAAVVLVIVANFLLERREKKRSAGVVDKQAAVISVEPSEEVDVIDEAPEEPVAALAPKPEPKLEPKKTPAKKKKSKSKRKKK